MTATQSITDVLLRYHRKNPLRVAFGTDALVQEHSGEEVEAAYQQLVKDGLMEPIYHRVIRNGKEYRCYRITKQGLGEQKKK